MQVKNTGKRKFVFADFELKSGETISIDASLKEEVAKLISLYPRDLKEVEIKKVAKAKKEVKADEVSDEEKPKSVKIKKAEK